MLTLQKANFWPCTCPGCRSTESEDNTSQHRDRKQSDRNLPDHSPTAFPSGTTLHTSVNCYSCQSHAASWWHFCHRSSGLQSLVSPEELSILACTSPISNQLLLRIFGVPNHCCNKGPWKRTESWRSQKIKHWYVHIFFVWCWQHFLKCYFIKRPCSRRQVLQFLIFYLF